MIQFLFHADAIFAVLLAVSQTPAPVPGKAADGPANTRSSIKSKADTNQNPSLPSQAPINKTAAQKQEHAATGQRDQNTEQPISIRKLPPVSVTKDWADWGIWAFSGLLVIVGGLQAWFLYRTLRAIKQQAGLMEQQEKQMGEQSGYMRESLKATQDANVLAQKHCW